MLGYLSIKNFGLIDDLNIEFDHGLNVITGETGAGKSMILEAINVILGASIKQSWFKNENEILKVEALFYLDKISQKQREIMQTKIDINFEDNNVIIRREINYSRRSKCFINNQLVNLSVIQNLGNYLIDLHGQHEHQSLLNPKNHIDFVDSFGSNEFLEKKEQYHNQFKKWQARTRLLSDKLQKYNEAITKKDYLLFQIEEISKAQLKKEEDRELAELLNIIRHKAKIKEIMENSYSILFDDTSNTKGATIYDLLTKIISDFRSISHFGQKIENIKESLLDIHLKLEDVSSQIINYNDNLDINVYQLQEAEERLNLINHLKYKYGPNIDSILNHQHHLLEQLNDMENSQFEIGKLEKEIKDIEKILLNLALELSEQRKLIAKNLEQDILSELVDLNMKNCDFAINFGYNEVQEGLKIEEKIVELTQNGIDKIEFFISTNTGEKLKPLNEIVSGGEISRIMLGLKSVLSKMEQIPTMIFDEIDSGVGARLGEAIAQKLEKIASENQVITVTHLPQIAVKATQHLYISKFSSEEKTKINIKKLFNDEQLYEIARMIDGEKYGSISIEHARKMLNKNGDKTNGKQKK